MISYFKYAFRNLLKQRGRTLINLIGLSVSLSIVIIIYLFVSGELRVNNFHEKKDRIYRMYTTVEVIGRGREYSPYQVPGMGPALKERIPGVENTCRLRVSAADIGPEEDLFQEFIGFVDSSFFDMFSYEFMAGDRNHPLSHPKSVVLTESVAHKIFSAEGGQVALADLVGRSIKFPERAPGNLYTVTAIIADPPANTSFYWDVLVPYENAGPYSQSNDFSGNTYTYVLLDENNNLEALTETARTLIPDMHGEMIDFLVRKGFLKEGEHNFSYHFMPYSELYLNSNDFVGAYETRGNKNAIYILISVAILILVIACFNYVMITIGTALNRMGDFGMMNVVGAGRWQILARFVVESFLLTLVSMLLGIILAEQILPLFNKLSGDDLKFSLYAGGMNFVFLGALLLFIVILTSTYIGFYLLRRTHPLRFLQKEMLSVRRNGVARLSVVIQFFIAISLLIAGGMILKQLHFLVNREVGFDREQTAIIRVNFSKDRINTLKEQIRALPQVSHVSMSDRNFKNGSSSEVLLNKRGELTEVRLLRIDTDYIPTLGLELLEGRNFMLGEGDDSIRKVIVNETLVRELEIEDPVGARVSLDTDESEVDIIGVVRDFHIDSMHDRIQALMLHMFSHNSYNYLYVKAESGQMAAVLEYCEKIWEEVAPEFTFSYEFLDEILEGQYKDEDRWSRVIAWAAAIAILLSCLGLMGISGILVARRYQEVGIRKANGATVGSIILLLNSDILKWVLLSYVLACPAAYFIIRRWLQDFAFRTGISWWVFALAGLAALFIAVLTITLQIYRVARQNPVKALRYE